MTHPAYRLLCRMAFDTAVLATTRQPKAERTTGGAGQQFTWSCEVCGAAGEVEREPGQKGRVLREAVSAAHRERSGGGCTSRAFEIHPS